MSWLKSLWDKVVNKTSTSPTLVIVEEEDGDVMKIFTNLCIEAGIQKRWVDRYAMASTFLEWYDGAANVESIKASIPQFKTDHPELASKLVRLK